MTDSSGNSLVPIAATEQRSETTCEFPPSPTETKRAYRKPALRRLGLLRSVTGSDLKW